MRVREKTICLVCGRVFFGPADQVDICGNCGNETHFKDIWVNSETGKELGGDHE